MRDGLTFRLRQVEGNIAFVAIDAVEIGARGLIIRRIVTRPISDFRLFDLDHLGSEIRHHLRRPRAGQQAAEVDDLDAGQHEFRRHLVL